RAPDCSNVKRDPLLPLPVSVFGKTNRPRLRDTFEPRGDVHAIPHQIAVALLHDVPAVDADATLDAALGRKRRVAFDHAALHFDGAPPRVDPAAELDDRDVASA